MSSIAGTSPRTGYGDCEDLSVAEAAYAGRCRPAAPRHAHDRGSLTSATRGRGGGGGGAVLKIMTDRGPFHPQDNVTDTILPWDETSLHLYQTRGAR